MQSFNLPLNDELRRILATALAEDIGHGDVTSQAVIAPETQGHLLFVAREPMVVAGIEIPGLVYSALDSAVDYRPRVDDGATVEAGTELASVYGPAQAILTGERVALNLLQRMSGIATETARYVQAVAGTGAAILDTRKTVPGLRLLDKYAVRCGGGQNHRLRLDDMVLIKDNHLALSGDSVAEAIELARAAVPSTMAIEVECDTLAQVEEALAAGASRILLDNMPPAILREAVALNQGRAFLEASGGVTLERVRVIAESGVNAISIGALTHSVRAVDIGLDMRDEIDAAAQH